MFSIKINEIEYKVRFGMNSFVDTDVMDRARAVIEMMNDDGEGDAADKSVTRVKELFDCTRELYYIGFKKYNPVATPSAVGDMLDDYIDEAPEGEERGIVQLFDMVTEELFNQGFLADLMGAADEEKKTRKKSPKV